MKSWLVESGEILKAWRRCGGICEEAFGSWLAGDQAKTRVRYLRIA